ncbi:MAG: hypothetical protein Kow0029_17810 [Candidatus Rifleibacteriota bacterium]
MNKEEKKISNIELRNFGLMVGVIFGLIALYPLVKGHPLRAWAAVISIALIAPAIIFPPLLDLPFRLWSTIGRALGWINTRIILTVLYFCVLFPVSVILRLLGKEPLKLTFDYNAETYREPPDNSHEKDMHNQY